MERPPAASAALLLRNQTAIMLGPTHTGAELSWRPPPVHTHITQHQRSARTHAAALQTHARRAARAKPTAPHRATGACLCAAGVSLHRGVRGPGGTCGPKGGGPSGCERSGERGEECTRTPPSATRPSSNDLTRFAKLTSELPSSASNQKF
jgi:hypothetical protein